MLHIFLSMLTSSVLGAETPLEAASLQKANGHLQPSAAELFVPDPSMEGVTCAFRTAFPLFERGI